jgi:hypothetical protein
VLQHGPQRKHRYPHFLLPLLYADQQKTLLFRFLPLPGNGSHLFSRFTSVAKQQAYIQQHYLMKVYSTSGARPNFISIGNSGFFTGSKAAGALSSPFISN